MGRLNGTDFNLDYWVSSTKDLWSSGATLENKLSRIAAALGATTYEAERDSEGRAQSSGNLAHVDCGG